ncbi:MAG: hypothetical protein DRH51_08510 [Candidatus Coatesbacteria bacterium]|nr:MAG: hypothetical protein DRH51_08510 [Candidatus Coatesbacteria bacterium]RLC41382.1 MAG: hypothetical protein DRH49_05540 [Candidatus Coatesbacteria bacterium]
MESSFISSSTLLTWLSLIGLAFLLELMDSSLGMGYGTTLTPVLILVGFKPLDIVPAVLFSELITGLSAAVFHHSFGNVNLKRRSSHLNVAMVLALCSVVGSTIAVFIAVNIPRLWLKTYIGALVLAIGLVIIFTLRRRFKFSWKRVIGLGLFASFNKGISGGGYGPLVTGGQILAGMDSKPAVGITSLAEGLTCAVGLILYIIIKGSINWGLAIPIAMGAFISTMPSAWIVSKISTNWLKLFIGIATIILGSATLIKVYF